MKVGPFTVEVPAEPTICDLCLNGAILTIRETDAPDAAGQPHCASDAGVKFASEPAVLGELVLLALFRTSEPE